MDELGKRAAVAMSVVPADVAPLPSEIDRAVSRNHERGRRFLDVRARRAALEAEDQQLKEEQARLEEEMFEEIEQTGETKFRVVDEHGIQHTLFVRREVRAHALDHGATVTWFSENGLGAKLQVQDAALLAVVKDFAARDVALPPELAAAVSVFEQYNIRSRIVPAKKKS